MQDGLTKAKEVFGKNETGSIRFPSIGAFGDLLYVTSIYLPDTVLKIYIKTMTEDDDKEVVAQACMAVADIIKDAGYMAIEPC